MSVSRGEYIAFRGSTGTPRTVSLSGEGECGSCVAPVTAHVSSGADEVFVGIEGGWNERKDLWRETGDRFPGCSLSGSSNCMFSL